ncbi:hypothetical protein ABTX85_35410 [Streptomyces sp. NPDC096097]|uniref:hypothetical protein n=1 Tax=Streptomyces sp. NPDC096097 TaxID=3155546 RepID=UPI00332E0984
MPRHPVAALARHPTIAPGQFQGGRDPQDTRTRRRARTGRPGTTQLERQSGPQTGSGHVAGPVIMPIAAVGCPTPR